MLARPIFISILPILLFTSSAWSKETYLTGKFTARVGATSDYSPRGIDQSNGNPALHAGFTYTDKTSLYTDVSVTSLHYNFDSNAYAEIDAIFGYQKLIHGINFNISWADYIYPNTSNNYDYTFNEFKLGVAKSFPVASVSATIQYSPDFWMHTGQGIYFPMTLTAPIYNKFSLITGAAYQSVENNKRIGVPDWWNGYVGVAYDYNTYNFSAKYVDTDIDVKCVLDCGPRVIFTMLKFF